VAPGRAADAGGEGGDLVGGPCALNFVAVRFAGLVAGDARGGDLAEAPPSIGWISFRSFGKSAEPQGKRI